MSTLSLEWYLDEFAEDLAKKVDGETMDRFWATINHLKCAFIEEKAKQSVEYDAKMYHLEMDHAEEKTKWKKLMLEFRESCETFFEEIDQKLAELQQQNQKLLNRYPSLKKEEVVECDKDQEVDEEK